MADDFSVHDVTNTGKGLRGLNTVDGYVEIDPGSTLRGVQLAPAELKSAERTGYFKIVGEGKAPATDEHEDDGEGLPSNVPKLRKIAKEEDVDVSGATSAADYQRLILAARADKAAKAGSGNQGGGDELDRMDDATLRNTVQALTGTAPAEGADRATLLALARGQG
jgi:hypothetical protein